MYLTILSGCVVMYIAYGEWLAWVLLLWMAMLPWLSLILSILPMLSFRVSPSGPAVCAMGDTPEFWLLGSCTWPMPPFQGQLALRSCFTGKKHSYQADMTAITGHCGAYLVTAEKVRIHDYLGLFSLPVRKKDTTMVLIRPDPVAVPITGALKPPVVRRWKPKVGGGFGENHELRQYRPGDRLNQVHWKLTAKTRVLMLREPVEPQQEGYLLTLNLRGTPQELDRKLGRLLWMGNYLLQREFPFQIRALTGDGILQFSISHSQELEKTVDTLLCRSLATQGDIRQAEFTAGWRYHLGGAPDEA